MQQRRISCSGTVHQQVQYIERADVRALQGHHKEYYIGY